MARRDEELLGRVAIREGFLTQAEIDECVRLQEEESIYRPLGALLIEKRYLEPRQLHAILQKQQQSALPAERLERKRENDRIFSKICLSRETLSFDHVNECLKLQTRKQKKGVFIPLSRLLIQKGYLTVDQVREIYKIQYGVVFFCGSCAVSYQIPDYSEEKAYPCPKCGAVLEFQDIQKSDAAEEHPVTDAGLDPVTTIGGEARFGQYRVRSELGRGAMGLVYLVYDEVARREVALKILPGGAGLNADTVERFKREAEAIRGLEHPSIIPIYDVGVEAGTHYYTMKYVKGTSLDILIDEERTDPAEACRIIIQAAEALEVAHRNGIVHRDIKPENLILEQGTGRVVVTDFGLAKAERSATLTASEAIVGTPCYMSPEQARGKKSLLNHRTDIYSLGATLYELLTFQLPFEGEDVQDILRQVVEDEPELPRKINPKLHRDIEAIVLKAMAKNPKRRYQSMREFAGDLKLFLRGRKVRAKAPGVIDRALQLLYRHREVVVVFLLVQTLILTGGVLFLYQIRQEQFRELVDGERSRAQTAEAKARSLQAELELLRRARSARLEPDEVAPRPDPVAKLLATAREARLAGDADRAWTLWRRAQEIDPSSWRLWLFRGDDYLRERKAEQAFEDFLRAARLAPDMVDVRREIARADLAMGRLEDALAEVSACLGSRPDDPVALSVRVQALALLGREAEVRRAREAFDRASSACRLSDAGERLERFALEEVRIESQRELGAGAPGPWTALSDEIAGPQAADPALFPARIGAWIWLRRAEGLRALGEVEEAQRALEGGLAIDPDHPLLLWRRGTVSDLRRAVAVAEGFADARAELARALLDRGLEDEARSHVRALERLSPGHPDLPALRGRVR